MSIAVIFLRRQAKRLTALGLIAGLWWFVQLPGLSNAERTDLAGRFQFSAQPLPELAEQPHHFIRDVHPSLEHIAAWISSVGASIALNDLDGDGLPNDICHVDTRTDQVIVAPVPGTSERYPAFALSPAPLRYDAATMAPMGCLPADLNEDGRMDILVYYWGRTPIAFLQSEGATGDTGGLAEHRYVRSEVVPGHDRWFTNAATMADLDGDGHADLIIGNYFQDGARILDSNADGTEQMQDSMSRAYNGGRNRFLLWAEASAGADPSVRFEEAADVLDEQVAGGWTLAVGAADLDGDLLPEIYFSNDFGPDRLLHNRSEPGMLRFELLNGEKGLTTPSSKVLGRDSFKGMGVDFGDLNGDGILDIYVSNIADEFALQESHFVWVSTGDVDRMWDGIAPYADESEPLGLSRSGWGWDTRLADFDNDGTLEALQATGFVKGNTDRWPELHELAMSNDELIRLPSSWPRLQAGDDLSGHQHNPFFVRAQDGRYYDIAPDLGLDIPQVTRGIATADVDGDGDLDFAVANQWEPSRFYRNDSVNTGAFLGLRLWLPVKRSASGTPAGVTATRRAITVVATVQLPDGRRLVAQVDNGNGHSGKRSPDLHFGLGDHPSEVPVQVDLRWRDAEGRVQGETLHLSAGWHTVLLGQSATVQAEP